MKILVNTTGFPRFEGDTFGVFVQDYVTFLAAKGFEVSVLAPHEKGLPFRRLEKGVTVYRLPYFPFSSLAYGSGIPTNLKKPWCKIQLPFFVAGMSFWTGLLMLKNDILHSQWSISAYFGILSKWLHRKPVIVSYRGSDLNSKGALRKISDKVSFKVNANICLSEEQSTLIPSSRFDIIPNLVDNIRFAPLPIEEKLKLKKQFGFENNSPIILYVGYLIPLKRVDVMIKMMNLLNHKEAQLIIAGDGLLKDELTSLTESLGLKERVHFYGVVAYHKIHEFFQVADIHLLCSTSEGRPNVLDQAMSTGIPSISTNVGCIDEMIDDGDCGFLSEPTPEAYAEKVNSLLENPSRLKEMGTKALKKSKKMGVDIDSVIHSHELLYKKVLSE